ncbi:MAG: 3-methyl-2-oxobutanoate hydroxymethyltransferase [Fermentimonas sp.]|nr:3-methyl-2-oxobutanoate hydroxymethyltransferase [Fermentimonas sp.]
MTQVKGYLSSDNRKKVTTSKLLEMKKAGEKISMLTAYDFSMATVIDRAGIDIILVGDSASNVMVGNNTTLPMTVDQMIYHGKSVMNGVEKAMVVVDMPFGSYHASPSEAVTNAVKIMRETEADCLKLEGGIEIIESVKAILAAGIPIMGHLGLMPQSINKYGSFGLRAKDDKEAQKLIEDAKLLEDAGCCSLVLEKIPAELAANVTKELTIPTIGIGAGPFVDGQVLVMHDMLGLNIGFSPKFLRRYANLYDVITEAVQSYINDVKSSDFPSSDESY